MSDSTLEFTVAPAEAPVEALEAVAQAISDYLYARRRNGDRLTLARIELTLASAEPDAGDEELLGRASMTGYRQQVEPFTSPGAVRRFFTRDIIDGLMGVRAFTEQELAQMAEAIIRTRTHCDF